MKKLRCDGLSTMSEQLGRCVDLSSLEKNLFPKYTGTREARRHFPLKGLAYLALMHQLATGCAGIQTIDFEEIGPIVYPKLPGRKIQAPEKGCYAGIYIDGTTDIAIKNYKNMVGKKPSMLFMHYIYQSQLPFGVEKSFIDQMEICGNAGVIPFVTYGLRMGRGKTDTRDMIIEGKLDKKISDAAEKLRRYGEKMEEKGLIPGFFIRTMREMNLGRGSWPWEGRSWKFKKTWQHIWNIFEQEGANEYATWVFNPFVGFAGPRLNNVGSSYYPGDRYVDWIGFNGYNWDGQGAWAKKTGFLSMFLTASSYYYKNHDTKPQMICETGMDNLSYKPKWVLENYRLMQSALPAIKGVSVWSTKWSYGTINHFDSRIDSSKKALDAYRSVMQNDYFI